MPVSAIERHVEALQQRQDGQQLLGLAGIGQRDHDVARGDHADVAVARLRRVQEERRAARAREGRRDLVADVPGLAHAGDDDAAFAGEQQPAGRGKVLAEPVDEGDDCAGLGGKHPPSAGDQLVG